MHAELQFHGGQKGVHPKRSFVPETSGTRAEQPARAPQTLLPTPGLGQRHSETRRTQCLEMLLLRSNTPPGFPLSRRQHRFRPARFRSWWPIETVRRGTYRGDPSWGRAPTCCRGPGGVRRLGSRDAGRGSAGHGMGVGDSVGALG